MALSQHGDALGALLYDHASQKPTLSLWSLNPRRTPGRGKIMNPGFLGNEIIPQRTSLQLLLRTSQNGDMQAFILGQDEAGSGSITGISVSEGIWNRRETIECALNGRLVNVSDETSPILWQSHHGILHEGELRAFGAILVLQE
jgi:hypothetical protein